MSKLPYLLNVDTKAVNEALQNQKKLFPLYSELYKETKRVGLNCSLVQLNELISKVTGLDKDAILNELVKKNLVDKMGKIEFGGVELKKEAMASMIVMPNLDSLKSLIQQIHSVNYYRNLINIELADVDGNDNITIKSDAKDILTEKYSVYADNEKQVSFYENAKVCAEAMNAFAEFSKCQFTEKRPVNGIIFNANTGKYIPDIDYIKQYIRES